MKTKKFFLSVMSVAMILASATFMSCKDSGGDDPILTDSELSGSIKETRTLDANITYTITGPVIVEDGGVLEIPAGTTIKAEKSFSSYILVLQGGKINVRGTAEKPVKMTSAAASPAPGDWGGLIINGKAPLTRGTDGNSRQGTTEINPVYYYGGEIANDNSGEITYLILEYTGSRNSGDVEHNGLTLNGVGNGTKIENIYIPDGADDGIEFFGGTVNVKNLLVVNSDDDMFDFTQGYVGTLENAYGVWEADYSSSEKDPRGIEADGNLDGNYGDDTNQSKFVVKNVTFDLRVPANADDVKRQMQDVIKVRRGAEATITNALVKGVTTVGDLIDYKDSAGDGVLTSSISLTKGSEFAVTGKEINPDAASCPNTKIEAGNSGCPTDIFGWTGYQF